MLPIEGIPDVCSTVNGPKLSFIEKVDTFVRTHRTTISLFGTLSPIVLCWHPVGVLTAIGAKVAIATITAAVALNVFEHVKPTFPIQTATLNLLHHFIVISLPIVAGMYLPSYLPSSMGKEMVAAIVLLATSIGIAVGHIFPPMNHDLTYRKLGLV